MSSNKEHASIIVRITGGIGNQMFQAAFVEELKSLGHNVHIDISDWEDWNVTNHNRYELDRVFGLKYDVASRNEKMRYVYNEHSFIGKVLSKLIGPKKNYKRESDFPSKESVFEFREGYLVGYWQNEVFFRDVKDRIREIFEFKDIKHNAIEDRIIASESVAVHIRRGDYLQYEEKYGGICNKDYYRKAIEYMREHVPNAFFFIFSDDEEYARSVYHDEDMEVVEGNGGENSYYDMYYMSKCKHNIVANSTFSWWGAYLNSNENKIVIRPERFNNVEKKDIYPDSWVIIK